ncbi:hypothetical protein PSD17_10040 [Pseudonocardia sp. D17]|nr:hypothetical protein PSD17_10040 [Pseudonocardia sp. D17]
MDMNTEAADQYEGLLCHCDVDPDGHPLGTPGCGFTIKRGTYRRTSATPRVTGAKGTCPECGRTGVKVTAPLVKGRTPASAEHTVPLGRTLQLGAHSRPKTNSPCPGAGQPPRETRFTPSPPETGRIRTSRGPRAGPDAGADAGLMRV